MNNAIKYNQLDFIKNSIDLSVSHTKGTVFCIKILFDANDGYSTEFTCDINDRISDSFIKLLKLNEEMAIIVEYIGGSRMFFEKTNNILFNLNKLNKKPGGPVRYIYLDFIKKELVGKGYNGNVVFRPYAVVKDGPCRQHIYFEEEMKWYDVVPIEFFNFMHKYKTIKFEVVNTKTELDYSQIAYEDLF